MKFNAFIVETEVIENGKRVVQQDVCSSEMPMDIELARKHFNYQYSLTKESKVIRGMNEEQYKEYQKEHKSPAPENSEMVKSSKTFESLKNNKKLPTLEQFLNLKK